MDLGGYPSPLLRPENRGKDTVDKHKETGPIVLVYLFLLLLWPGESGRVSCLASEGVGRVPGLVLFLISH